MSRPKRAEFGDSKAEEPATKEESRQEPRVVLTSDFDALHVRRVVASNPNTPRQVLERLASEDAAVIRRHVAENPKTPVEILRKLARDCDPDVRLAVAENPHTPPDVLTILAGDVDDDVRYGVAENPHMPEDILLDLAQDDNPYIRCRALKTLDMLAPDVQSRLKLLLQQPYDHL